MRVRFQSLVLLGAIVGACGAPTPSPIPPSPISPPPLDAGLAEAGVVDAGATDADAGAADAAPRSTAKTIFDVSFVNLSVFHGSLEIDSEHHGIYRSQSDMHGFGDHEPTVIEGTVSDAAVAHLLEVVKRARLCKERLPPDEPMVWITVDVPSDPPCSLKMSPGVWRKRHPDVLRAIHAVEREVCSGACPRSPTFD